MIMHVYLIKLEPYVYYMGDWVIVVDITWWRSTFNSMWRYVCWSNSISGCRIISRLTPCVSRL